MPPTKELGTLGYCHVRKEDLRSGSARDVDPPFASFDVVIRRDYDALLAERDALRKALERIASGNFIRRDAYDIAREALERTP